MSAIMQRPAIEPADGTEIFPDLPYHAANEAEFVALVEVGLASLKIGPNLSLEDVEIEVRRLLYSKA